MDLNLANYATNPLALGRAAVFYAPDYWDGNADLALTHLGVTLGEVGPPNAEEINALRLEEITGTAQHEATVKNPDVVIEFSAIVAERTVFELLSPTGSSSAGYRRPRPVKERTLVLLPEALFVEDDEEITVGYTSVGGWTVGGDAATPAQLALIDLSLWFWRGYFLRTNPVFREADGGLARVPVRFQLMQDLTKPDGEQLWTLGDPADAAIELDVA